MWGGREGYAQLCIPGSRVWVAGPTMDLAEKEFRIIWDLTVNKGFIPVRRKSERELWIDFDNGSFLECRSEEQPDGMIGEGLDLVILAEAARMKLSTWDRAIRPALADRQGKAIFSSTPRGFNWFDEFYQHGQPENRDEFPDWESWMIPSAMNPLLPAAEIEEARKNSSPETFAQEWEAKSIAYGGMVFKEFEYNVHVRVHPFEPYQKTALWIDPGISNPYSVLLVQITPDDQIRVLDEIYTVGKVTNEIILMAQEKWPHALLIGNEPRKDIDVVIDEAAAESAASWRLAGYRAGGGKPGVKQGIEVIRRMLRDPFRTVDPTDDNPHGTVPRITFNPRCKHTIREFSLYHYPDEGRRRQDINPAELPVDIDNHSISALKYGLYWTFPDLFNTANPSDTIVYATPEDLGIAEDMARMRIDDGYSHPDGMSFEREWSLGNYD